MANEKKSVFDVLNDINVNGHTESKNGLTYLSWAWAWAEVKKVYPDAVYEIEKFNGIPYAYDPITGFMVYTKVTIGEVTHEMWLPVMDATNHAMKAEPYVITNKWGKETKVEAATMFDVNKTIMRCLVKNLAMFGLGLYIYAGEDLPEVETEEAPAEKSKKTAPKKAETKAAEAPKKPKFPNRNEFLKYCDKENLDTAALCAELGLTGDSKDEAFIEALNKAKEKVAERDKAVKTVEAEEAQAIAEEADAITEADQIGLPFEF